MSNLDILTFNRNQLTKLWSDVTLTMVDAYAGAPECWNFRPNRSFNDLLITGDQLTMFWTRLQNMVSNDDEIESSDFIISASDVDIVDILVNNADRLCQRSVNIKDRFVTSTFRYLRAFIDFDPIERIKERREDAKLPKIPDLSNVNLTQEDLDFMSNYSIKHKKTPLEELTLLDTTDIFE